MRIAIEIVINSHRTTLLNRLVLILRIGYHLLIAEPYRTNELSDCMYVRFVLIEIILQCILTDNQTFTQSIYLKAILVISCFQFMIIIHFKLHILNRNSKSL